MSEAFPVLNTKIDYEKQYLSDYSKNIEFPSTRCLNAFFHPSLRDHVITINEVNFPKIKADQISAMFHNRQSADFENKMRSKYEQSVSHLIVKRRKKLGNNLAYRDKSEEESFPDEPSSSEWEESDSDFEGGQKEKLKKRNSIKSKHDKKHKPKTTRRTNKKNQIVINDPPKLKGSYPKIDSKSSLSKKFGEDRLNSKMYSTAVNLYLEDHSSLFGYQDYDESMMPDEPEHDLANYLYSEDKYRLDEYSEERNEYDRSVFLGYTSIPPIDGMHYFPPPFRNKYEISIWRVDLQNVAKIKHWYFTPEVRIIRLHLTFGNLKISLDTNSIIYLLISYLLDFPINVIFNLPYEFDSFFIN